MIGSRCNVPSHSTFFAKSWKPSDFRFELAGHGPLVAPADFAATIMIARVVVNYDKTHFSRKWIWARKRVLGVGVDIVGMLVCGN